MRVPVWSSALYCCTAQRPSRSPGHGCEVDSEIRTILQGRLGSGAPLDGHRQTNIRLLGIHPAHTQPPSDASIPLHVLTQTVNLLSQSAQHAPIRRA